MFWGVLFFFMQCTHCVVIKMSWFFSQNCFVKSNDDNLLMFKAKNSCGKNLRHVLHVLHVLELEIDDGQWYVRAYISCRVVCVTQTQRESSLCMCDYLTFIFIVTYLLFFQCDVYMFSGFVIHISLSSDWKLPSSSFLFICTIVNVSKKLYCYSKVD